MSERGLALSRETMAKGRFFNQKLGKRTGRRQGLMKAQLAAERARLLADARLTRKKDAAREPGPPLSRPSQSN